MGDPYRESAEPYREPRLDGLEQMRLEQRERSARRAKFYGPPFGIGFIVVPLFFAGQLVLSIYDGLPFAVMHAILIAVLALVSSASMYAMWRGLPRIISVILIAGSLVGAGSWLRSNTAKRRAARINLAESWCTDEMRDAGTTQQSCVARVERCIAQRDRPFGRADAVIVVGHPCGILDAGY